MLGPIRLIDLKPDTAVLFRMLDSTYGVGRTACSGGKALMRVADDKTSGGGLVKVKKDMDVYRVVIAEEPYWLAVLNGQPLDPWERIDDLEITDLAPEFAELVARSEVQN